VRRNILGISAAALLLAAGAVWLWMPQAELTLAFCWRGGALLAVAWLAYEDVQRLPGWLLLAVPAVLIVVARWPRLIVAIVPLLLVLALLRRMAGKP
jgi:hypothetical protein